MSDPREKKLEGEGEANRSADRQYGRGVEAAVEKGRAEEEAGLDNEGEGSRSADRQYRRGVEATVEKGHAEEEAERAARDVAADPEPFRRAEDEGRRHSAGEAPGDLER